jgi:hypothetical protein
MDAGIKESIYLERPGYFMNADIAFSDGFLCLEGMAAGKDARMSAPQQAAARA